MSLWTCVLSCFAMQDVPAGAEPILFDAIPDHIALVDLDEESGLDWVEVREGVLEWDAGGGSKLRIEFHGESVLWAVGDWDNDGRQDLVALVEGQTLECLLLSEGNLTWKTVLSGLGGKNKVPRGVRPAAILRDINGDSWDDLVVPVGEQVELWFGVSGQSPTPGPTLAVASTLSLAVEGMHGSNLLATVSRSLVVPEIRMRDISGDGRPDLLVTEQETVRQYIAGEEGITGVATAEVDFSKFRERLPEVKFDPGNIASLSKYAVLEEWSDLNNDGALDLLVLSGGTVFVYLGGKNGLDLRRPRDQMPTHGNVVYATAVSINEDEIPDLVLLRVEDISLARLFSFVFMDVEIDFDFLAYQGRGDGRFHKRPMKESKSVRLKLPSLLNLADNKDAADPMRRSVFRLADFDGDGEATDLVALDDRGQVSGWRQALSDPEQLERLADDMVEKIMASPSVVQLDVETLGKWAMGKTSLLASLVEERVPDFQLPAVLSLPKSIEIPQSLAVRDFDGDGRAEIFVVQQINSQAGGLPRADSGDVLSGYLFDPDSLDS